MWWLIALAPLAYLLGTFPSAVLVARADGVDITQRGSGNPGASNVTRVMGWKHGALVFALDAGKGALAAGGGWILAGRSGGYGCAAAAALGHMFPVTRRVDGHRFRGGKGVATVGGAMLVLQPIVAAALAVIWGLTTAITRKASVASLLMVPLLPLGAGLLGAPAWEIAAIVALGVLVAFKHRTNVQRLLAGRELTVEQDG